MVVALKEVKIRGEIRTIVDYVVDMIQAPEFVGNRIHTGWLDSRIAAQACFCPAVSVVSSVKTSISRHIGVAGRLESPLCPPCFLLRARNLDRAANHVLAPIKDATLVWGNCMHSSKLVAWDLKTRAAGAR